jgi:hypothetical protein
MSPNQRGRSEGFNDNYVASWELAGNEGLFIGFQICLHGDGINIGESDEPLVHVFRWNCGRYYASLGWNMGYFSDAEFKPLAEIWGDSLIVWPDEEGDEFQWTFSLCLAALSDKESLSERICNPITKLLDNSAMKKDEYEANPISPWEGLVRYDKNKMTGYPLGLNPRRVD